MRRSLPLIIFTLLLVTGVILSILSPHFLWLCLVLVAGCGLIFAIADYDVEENE